MQLKVRKFEPFQFLLNTFQTTLDSDQSESKLLTTLDNDCLGEVFKYLPLRDLVNAAEVCVRFKKKADDRFKSRYVNMHVSHLKKVLDNPDEHFEFEPDFAEQVLRNFGQFVQSFYGVYSNSKDNNRILLSLLGRYCAGTLKELRLNKFPLYGRLLCHELRSMFAGLQKLTLFTLGTDRYLRDLLSTCCELKYLMFGNYRRTFNEQSLLVKFPKLLELKINFFTRPISIEFLDEILRLNDSIQKLSLFRTHLSSNMCEQITKHLPRLQSLTIDQDFIWKREKEEEVFKNFFHLNQLKSLKELTLDCAAFSLSPLIDSFVEAKVPLEYLGVMHGKFDAKLIESLKALDSFRRLGILNTRKMTGTMLVDTVKHFPELTELYTENLRLLTMTDVKQMLIIAKNLHVVTIRYSVYGWRRDILIDDDIITSILQVVKSRRTSKKLVLAVTLESEQVEVTVSKKLLKQNRYWIQIRNDHMDPMIKVPVWY